MTAKQMITTIAAVTSLLVLTVALMATMQPAHSETQLLFGNEQSQHRITYEDICG